MNATYTLNNGKKMPALGLGTWQAEPGEVGRAVEAALKNGYKHIDGAFIYLNEKEVGAVYEKVFKSGSVKREDIFITSKLWNYRHRPDLVKSACEKTLSDLKLDYLDLYLIHWPVSTNPDGEILNNDFDKTPIIDTWREMEKLVESGKVKSIGVCNFSPELLEDLIKQAKIKPAVNQVELNPYLPQPKLLEFCKKNNIHVTAYSPLGSGASPSVLQDPIICEIAKKHNITPAQVALSWNVQRGTTVIPKSVKESRIIENSKTITLDQEDMDKISTIKTRVRVCDPLKLFENTKIFD